MSEGKQLKKVLVAHVSLWCRRSIIGVRKWCSFHIRPPCECRAHALPGPIETSCCCWWFCYWSISVLCCSPHTKRFHSHLFPVRASPFLTHFFSPEKAYLLCSEHCLLLAHR